MEQEEYTKEEIDWSYIDYVDNQDILDLIEKVWISPTVAKHFGLDMLHQLWLYIASQFQDWLWLKADFFYPT